MVCEQNIHGFPRRRHGHASVNAAAELAVHQLCGDDRQSRPGGVTVPSGSPYDKASRAGGNIDIAVRMDLRGAQDHAVQRVYDASAVERVGVKRRADPDMVGVRRDRLNDIQIKALYVQKLSKYAFVQHIHDVSGDAAEDRRP